jgi:multidrug efflux pump subunit AcrB
MELTPHGAALGFSIEEVGRQIRNAFDGAVPFRFPRGDDEVTVRLVQAPASPGSQALREFELRSPTGNFVPLSEVVDMTERQGFSAIQRRDGKARSPSPATSTPL